MPQKKHNRQPIDANIVCSIINAKGIKWAVFLLALSLFILQLIKTFIINQQCAA